MSLTKDQKEAIGSAVAEVVVSAGLEFAVNVIKQCLVSAYVKRNLAGRPELNPRANEAALVHQENNGSAQEGALAQSEVVAEEEGVHGNEVEVNAAISEAEASHNQADALDAHTGALDTESQGLKMG